MTIKQEAVTALKSAGFREGNSTAKNRNGGHFRAYKHEQGVLIQVLDGKGELLQVLLDHGFNLVEKKGQVNFTVNK